MNYSYTFKIRGLRLRAYQGSTLIYQRRLTGPEVDLVRKKLGDRLERDSNDRA